ncbi:MAG: hypothetical protein CL561_06495 [Alphaproteobacteria bacterium]|nr:hypothetical protein [Alphaproteobacteria bacterium]|tara:strand:- start:94 stop:1032 length:939 start_codon:yes stop_codon:yes gene_type:complete
MAINKHSLERAGMCKVDGGEVGYRYYEPHNEAYKKRAPLMLIHGGPGGSHIGMYDALNKLADTRPVIGYDQLGSYLSPAKVTTSLMQVERFAEEPRYLLDHLNVDKAVLLGHSWGGVIIGEFALKYPDRVAGLVFSAPLLSTQRWVDDCNGLLAQLPLEMQKTIRECEANGTTDSDAYKAADEFFGKRHFCRASRKPSSVAASAKRSNREIYNKMWGPSEFTHSGTLGDYDLFPRLNQITAPTMFICGEYDTATPATMKDAQAEVQGAKLHVVPNAGHACITDGYKNYTTALKSFLKDDVDAQAAKPPAPKL